MLETVGESRVPAIPPQVRVLNDSEAALVWMLSWSGDPKHIIAAKLGTMPSKVAGILDESTHVGSKDFATKLMLPKQK